jgi:hypothetical protein
VVELYPIATLVDSGDLGYRFVSGGWRMGDDARDGEWKRCIHTSKDGIVSISSNAILGCLSIVS